jgi:hypothetical protein
MEIEQHYVVKLTHQEACALKALLGKRSQKTDITNGLTEEESHMMSNLYGYLPNKDDE